MTAILALDPSHLTGVAYGVPGGTPILSVWKLRDDPDDEPEEVFRRAATLLWRRLVLDPPVLMAIEVPVPPHMAKGKTQHKTSALMLGLYGLYVGIARARGVKVIPAPIRTWRKCAIGAGNLPGEQAKALMVKRCRQLGWEAPDHNAAEAGGIWLWACGHVQAGIVLGRARAA